MKLRVTCCSCGETDNEHDLPEDMRAALAGDIRDPALQRRIIAHWKDPKGIGEDRLPWLVVS